MIATVMDNIRRKYYRIYTFFLLVLIVDATANESNETTHERRQSRVTGRIVKLYSGTRPEPILCAGEGFQAHPHDCAVFYRCMKSGNGKYTVFRFQCGPGTVYDPESEICNHPRSTKRSECGGLSTPSDLDRVNNNEIEGMQQEIPSPIINRPIYTKIPMHVESTTQFKESKTTTINSWVTSSPIINTSTKGSSVLPSTYPWASSMGHSYLFHTIQPLNIVQNTVNKNETFPDSSSRNNICTSDGFMGDSENCRKFYRCVANQRGSYTKYEFSCSESTIWDDDTQSCNHAWAVKRSRCGRSNQNKDKFVSPIAFVTTEKTKTSQKSDDKTIQQQLQISYGSKVTQTQTQISNGSVIQNQTQVHYGDPINKTKAAEAKQNQTQISYGLAVSQTQTQIDYGDKGVQTQLQIDHSQQSSQTQVQVHESTTSGTSTATDHSTTHADDNAKCAKLGFMGDPKDCKKFYRCIDNGKGGYTKFEFSCGDGTVWDPSIEACNHAWAVKECGGNGLIHTTGATQAATSITQSTQNYYTTVSSENHHTTSEAVVTEDNEDNGYVQQNLEPTSVSSTDGDPPTTISSSNVNCQFSGFMGDANDCKIFYRCVENGRGSYTKYEFKCGEGTVWDPHIEACNHAWAVTKCGGTATPNVDKVELTTEKLTTHSAVHTQSTLANHSATELSPVRNDDNDSGYGSLNNELTTTTTTTSTQKPHNLDHNMGNNCQSSGFLADYDDCKKFYRCVDNGSGGFTRYEFTCGEGTVWDSKIEACNHAWAVEKCGKSSSIAEHQETSTYSQPTIIHENDNSLTESNINTSSLTPIPSTTLISSSTTESVSVGSNDCTHGGFIGDQNDCKKFYRCVDNGNKFYTKYEFSCGEGTVWDSKIEACNHAWAVEKCGESGSIADHQETTTYSKPTIINEDSSSSTESNINTSSLTPILSTTLISSSTTESVSVGSNDCTHGGFMGDQNDCKKFYRCVDNGNKSYTKYEFSCGEGTVWDGKIEACNHAWAVKKCGGNSQSFNGHPETTTQYQPTMSDEIGNGYPLNVDPGSDITTQSTSTLSTTEGSKDSNEGNNCLYIGFIGDENNCKKFYRCVDDGKEGFIRYEFSCGEGTLWDQSIEACNHAWAVNKNCTSGNNIMHTSSEGTSQTTVTSGSQDQEQTLYTEKTSTSTISNYQDNEISKNICSNEGFFGDKNDCKMFYRCVDNGQSGFTKHEFKCGEGTYWNQEILSCDHASSDQICGNKGSTSQIPQHEHDEIYTEATTISSPLTTQNSVKNPTQKPQPSTGVCTSEGFYGDQNNCRQFYRCVDNGKGSYIKYDFTCGDGTVWDQEIQGCNHESSNKNCSGGSRPVTPQTNEHNSENEENISMTTFSPTQHSTEKTESSSSGSTSNQCTSEGFFADANDCKKFIRCVSNDKGGYTKYEFSCGEGTIWVQDILACDHDTGDIICTSQTTTKPLTTEEHQQTTERHKPSSSTSGLQAIDKQEDEYDNGNNDKPSHSDSQTTESSSTMKTTTSKSSHDTTSGNIDTCDSEGYFGDSHDCKKFYRCVDNGKGGYTKYDYTCGEGTIWDQDVTTCNHPQDVVNPSCNQNQDVSTSSTSVSSSSSSGLSEGTTTTIEATPSSSNCSQEETSKKPGNQNITCTKAGYYANPNDCKKFYRCVDWDGDGKRFSVYHFDCGEGTIWDPAVETCNHEESVYPPRVCDGSQSQSETQSPTTEATSKPQQEITSTPQNTTPQSSSTTQSSTVQIPPSSSSEQTTGQQSTTTELITTEQYPSSELTTTQSTTSELTTQSTSSDQTTEPSTTSKQTTTQHSTTSGQTTLPTPNSNQTTQPSTTSELTTQQSTTSEQTTSEQTTTHRSTTSEVTSEQSTTTSEQTTQQSTTLEQTTSEQTTTQRSTTSEPTTDQSTTTSEQTTQQYTSSEQTTSEQTSTQRSTTSEETTTEQSTTSEQTTKESTTTELTTTQRSTTSESTTTEQSTSSEQITQESTTSEPTTTEKLSTSDQTSEEATTAEQSTITYQTTTEHSTTTSDSATEESSSNTESSTTDQGSSQQSTTTEKSEQSTTQASTFSEGTTTQESNTDNSTTEKINESSTTEGSTEENLSDNKCPETDKSQNLFVCPTSFRRHPKYCNLFYQCDEDDDTHEVKIAIFTCPNNTIYDESQTRCVEESKADNKCNGQIAQKRRFKRLNKDYKEPIVVTKDSYACTSAGYFSFEKDSECSPAFLRCKTDKTNRLRGLVYQCPLGYVYWSTSKRCESINSVRDCKRSHNNWTGRWEIPVERRNVAPA